QLFGTIELDLGEIDQGLGDIEAGGRLIESRLEGSLIDGEQEITRLDDGPILEMHLIEISADARAYRDLVHRLEPPDEFVILDDLAHDRFRDCDRDGSVCLSQSLERRSEEKYHRG